MTTQYIWSVESLQILPNYENKTNVVSVVNWIAKANNGTNEAFVKGILTLKLNKDLPFVLYKDLTENTVLSWVHSSLGDAEIKNIHQSLDEELKNLCTPLVEAIKLPWAV